MQTSSSEKNIHIDVQVPVAEYKRVAGLDFSKSKSSNMKKCLLNEEQYIQGQYMLISSTSPDLDVFNELKNCYQIPFAPVHVLAAVDEIIKQRKNLNDGLELEDIDKEDIEGAVSNLLFTDIGWKLNRDCIDANPVSGSKFKSITTDVDQVKNYLFIIYTK